METQKKRIFLPNNYSSALNNYSYYKNNTSLKKQLNNNYNNGITPSYSGNPDYNNNKKYVYPPNNSYLTNKTSLNSFQLNIPKKSINIDINNNNNQSKNYSSKYTNLTSSIYTNTNSKPYVSPITTKSNNIENQFPIYSTPYIQSTPNYDNIPKKIVKNYSSPYLNINRSEDFSKKKTLILDLDETLVHSGFNPFTRKSDIMLTINVDGKNHNINVLKRPYVDEFLKEMSKIFEIVTFTASISEYAAEVLNHLDKNHYFTKRLFRQDCVFDRGLYIKDLKILGKDLKDLIIIDNNPVSYAFNEDNGIPILTWYDDLNDNELLKLVPLLKFLSKVDDVRPFIRRIVNRRTNEVDFYLVNNIINNKNNENDKLERKSNYVNDDYYRNKYLNEKENNIRNKDGNLDENAYRKYLDNDNYYRYNSTIDSFSNMSYNEIQNEGHLSGQGYTYKNLKDNVQNNQLMYNQNINEKIENRNQLYTNKYENMDNNRQYYNNRLLDEKSPNINKDNNYVIQDYKDKNNYSKEYIKLIPYKPYVGYNQKNYENNNEDNNKDIINNNIRNNGKYTPNTLKNIYKDNSYNPDNDLLKNNKYNNENNYNYKDKENDREREYYDMRMSNNLHNRSTSNIFSYIKKEEDLKINNFVKKDEKINEKPKETGSGERLSDYYLQSYKKHLLRSKERANSQNYTYLNRPNNNNDNNEPNSMIKSNYKEKNKNANTQKKYHYLIDNGNNNGFTDNYKSNNNINIDLNKTEYNKYNINNKINNENEQIFLNREKKLAEMNENLMKKVNILNESNKKLSYNNYIKSKKDTIFGNNNTNIRSYQDKKDLLNIKENNNTNNYLINFKNENLIKEFAKEKNNIINNYNYNATPNRLFHYKNEKYNINHYNIENSPKKETNIKYIHINNKYSDPKNLNNKNRIETEISPEKLKKYINIQGSDNNEYKDRINMNRSTILSNETNKSSNLNENNFKYLHEINKTEKKDFFPPSKVNNVNIIDNLNYSYKSNLKNINELTPLRNNYNKININNLYNSPNIENRFKNKLIEGDNNEKNKNEKNVKNMNRSSSYFHPSSTIKSYVSIFEEKKNNNLHNKNNKILYESYSKNNNKYKNNLDNKKGLKDPTLNLKLFQNNKSNILKNKFLYNYNNNEFE